MFIVDYDILVFTIYRAVVVHVMQCTTARYYQVTAYFLTKP